LNGISDADNERRIFSGRFPPRLLVDTRLGLAGAIAEDDELEGTLRRC